MSTIRPLLLVLCLSPRLLAQCNVTVPASISAPAAANTRSLSIQTACSWAVTQVPYFVSIIGPSSGTGDATLVLSFQRNASAIGMSGVLRINDQDVTVHRQGVNSIYPDYNNDGRTDLLWRHAGGAPGIVFTGYMNGTSTSGGRTITMEADAGWNAYPAHDWTGGMSDMYWVGTTASTRHTILKYVLDGYGVSDRDYFSSTSVIAGFTTWDDNGMFNTTQIIAGYDTDGGPLILRTHPYTAPVHSQPPGWDLVGIADVDGNLRSDYLFRHQTDGRCFVALVANAPNQLIDAGTFHTDADYQWQIAATGDVDGDGRADLIWRHMTDGRIWTMLMNGLSWTPGAVVWTEPDTHWVLKGTGDFNGDGRADLLFRNDQNGMVFVVLLDGNNAIGAGIAHYEPDLLWRLVGPTTTRSMLAANSSSVP